MKKSVFSLVTFLAVSGGYADSGFFEKPQPTSQDPKTASGPECFEVASGAPPQSTKPQEEECCEFAPVCCPLECINPASRIQICNGVNLFAIGEFLYWKPQMHGLAYAQEGAGNGTATQNGGAFPISGGSINFNGNFLRVHPNWDPGFRVGLGYNIPYDDWVIYLNWTRFYTDAKDSKDLLPTTGLTLWAHADQSDNDFANFASARWKFHLNTLDLILGRPSWVGNCFSLFPYLGLQGAWLKQNFKIHYDLYVDPANVLIDSRTMDIEAKSNFKGIGIEMGLDPQFTFNHGFSIDGKAALAVLYGHFNCDFVDIANGVFIIGNSRDHFHNGVTHLRLALGPRWDGSFACDRVHFSIYALWEENFWFGVNRMNHWMHQLHEGIMDQEEGSLIIQGLTLGAGIDF